MVIILVFLLTVIQPLFAEEIFNNAVILPGSYAVTGKLGVTKIRSTYNKEVDPQSSVVAEFNNGTVLFRNKVNEIKSPVLFMYPENPEGF